MTDQKITATGTTAEPRRRGVFTLDEGMLARALRLPDGQRVIGFRTEPARLAIDVCVEGEGLPLCPPNTEPKRINGGDYTQMISQWALHGGELEDMVRVLLDEMEPHVPGSLADLLQRTLDGTYDPRAFDGVRSDA